MLDPKDLESIEKLLDKRDKKTRRIVREEIEAESENIRSELSSDILNTKAHLSNEINGVRLLAKNIQIKTTKVLKNQEKMDKFLDKEHMYTVRRVDRVESHLELPPLQRPELTKV